MRAAGRRFAGCVDERRAVARGERPVVGVALHRGDAVVEGAEHRQAAVEQTLVVRVVGAGRRAPHHVDGLGRGLRGFDDVARERFAERHDRARDRDHEDVDVLVGEDHVEDLAAPRVGDRRTAAVDGIRHAQVRGNEPVVQLPLRLLGEIGEAQARVGEDVGHVRAGAARDRVDAHARLASRDFAQAGTVAGCVRANDIETSSSSSRPSTRVTPNWRKTAEVTASEPVRWPVCDCAIERPAAVLPTFTITIGLRSCAAWSAASISVRPSLKPSM